MVLPVSGRTPGFMIGAGFLNVGMDVGAECAGQRLRNLHRSCPEHVQHGGSSIERTAEKADLGKKTSPGQGSALRNRRDTSIKDITRHEL